MRTVSRRSSGAHVNDAVRIETPQLYNSAVTGAMTEAKILSGRPALTGNAIHTLKRWRFEPIMSDGKAVRAVAVMAFTFRL